MKKSLFLFLSISAVFLFTSSASGPVLVQQSGYAGSPIEGAQTCGSCHSGGSFGSSATLEVFDAAGTTAVTKYALGQQYTIRLTIAVTSGTPAGYGFNMIDLRQSNNVNVKGFLPTAQQATNIGINAVPSTGNTYAEQTQRLSTKVINVKWKAPSTNLGTIVFYAAANAVNGNSNTSGDSPTAGTSLQLPPASTGTYELGEQIDIQVSPNPTPSTVSVMLDSKMSKQLKIQITDIQGRIVLSDNWAVTVGQNQRSLDINTFVKGLYMVQIIDNRAVVSKKILKI